MRICTLVVLMLTTGMVVLAQPQAPAVEWEHRYGDRLRDDCFAVVPTSDNGYLACGNFSLPDFGFINMSIIKINSCGDSLWSRSYRTIYWEQCIAAQATPDGGFFLAGHTWTNNTIGLDFMLLKINAQGDSLWSRTYGCDLMDLCSAAQITPDGGCLLIGQADNPSADTSNGWVVRTDSAGNLLWSRIYGGTDLDELTGILPTSNQDYIVSGWTRSSEYGFRFWLMRISGDGDIVWNHIYDGPYYTRCNGVIQTADGGYLLYGREIDASFSDDFRLIKTDSAGNFEWSRTYGSANFSEECLTACQTSDGGFILAGFIDIQGENYLDGLILRTNAQGDSLWSMRLGGVDQDCFKDILPTSDGGYILGGYVSVLEDSMSITTSDMWLVKLAPEMFVRDTPIPRSLYLLSAYPNPFNSTTQIEFTLPTTQRVSLRLYDVLGREVAVLLDEMKTARDHRVTFDGSGLSSGVYFCRMEAGTETRTQKIVLMK